MHPIARILAVAYLALAAVGGVVLVQTTVNYVNVTEVTVNIQGNVAISSVQILWNRSSSVPPALKVSVRVTNPGRIPIEATSVDFTLHMDDVDDLYPPFDPDGLLLTQIGVGGITRRSGQGFPVGPGETLVMDMIVSVTQDKMARFDRPDSAGRYHPVVTEAGFVYFFIGFDLPGVPLPLAWYYEAQGVLPIG